MKPTIRIIAGVILASICASTLAASKYSAVNVDEMGFGDISVTAMNERGFLTGEKENYDIAIWGHGKEIIIDQSRIHLGPPRDFNNSNQFITWNNDRPGYGVLYDNGKFIDLPTLGGRVGAPFDINNNGQVVGYASTAKGIGLYQQHAVLWENGKANDLGTYPGIYTSAATAINDNGVIVGYAEGFGVMWSDGKISKLESLPDTISPRPIEINNNGQIIGTSLSYTNGDLATIWNHGIPSALGMLAGHQFSEALSINDGGQVVGQSYGAGSLASAVLWDDGHLIDINSLMDVNFLDSGFTLTQAFQITNNGLILARGYNETTGIGSEFVLSPIPPVPEPTTWAMLLAGLGLVGFVVRARW